MVHIEVNDRDFLDLLPVLAQSVRRGQRNVVDEAEAVGTSLLFVVWVVSLTEDASMMARWPSRAESIPAILSHNLVNRLNSSTCRRQGGFPCFFGSHSVLVVEVSNNFVARALQLGYLLHHFLDVVEVMDLQYISKFGPLVDFLLEDKGRFSLVNELDSVGEKPDLLVD